MARTKSRSKSRSRSKSKSKSRTQKRTASKSKSRTSKKTKSKAKKGKKTTPASTLASRLALFHKTFKAVNKELYNMGIKKIPRVRMEAEWDRLKVDHTVIVNKKSKTGKKTEKREIKITVPETKKYVVAYARKWKAKYRGQ